jgi:hypothetical protein
MVQAKLPVLLGIAGIRIVVEGPGAAGIEAFRHDHQTRANGVAVERRLRPELRIESFLQGLGLKFRSQQGYRNLLTKTLLPRSNAVRARRRLIIPISAMPAHSRRRYLARKVSLSPLDDDPRKIFAFCLPVCSLAAPEDWHRSKVARRRKILLKVVDRLQEVQGQSNGRSTELDIVAGCASIGEPQSIVDVRPAM